MLSVEDRLEVMLKLGGLFEPCVISRVDQDIVTISEIFDAVENFTDENIAIPLGDNVESRINHKKKTLNSSWIRLSVARLAS